MFNNQIETRSSSVKRNLSDSTLDSYSDFKDHLLLNIKKTPDNFEDDTKTFRNSKQNTSQVSPQGFKLKKPLNGLLSDVQGIKNSNITGLNKIKKDKGRSNSIKEFLQSDVSTKRKSTKINSTANSVENKPMTRSTSRNLENNFSGCSNELDVPEKRTKRILFDTEEPSKKATKKPKTMQNEKFNQTDASLPELSDTAVSIFLKKFDHEMAINSVNNLVTDSAPFPAEDLLKPERNNLFKRPNQRNCKKLPKRRCADRSQRAVAQLLQEEVSLSSKKDFGSDDSFHDKDFQIDQCDSISNESDNTNESDYVENKSNSRTRTKIGFSKVGGNVSVCSDAESILSNTSRYGRVRKTVPKYVNATMFGGTSKKSIEIQQTATTLINSHKCKSKPSTSFAEASNIYLDQFDLLSPTHKKSDSSEFKKLANHITSTSSKNGSNFRGSQSRTLSKTPRKSSLIDYDQENKNSKKSDFVSPPHNETTSPKFNQTTPLRSGNKIANRLNHNRALKSSNEALNKNYLSDQEHPTFDGAHSTWPPQRETVFKKPIDINKFKRSKHSSVNSEISSNSSKKILIHQNVILHPPNHEKNPVEYVNPVVPNLLNDISLPKTLRSNVSHATFQTTNDNFDDVFDDLGRSPDPNEINGVVNDEVVSFQWYSPMPDLDSVLSNDNVHYSMTDLKSFYTNVKVGYLKIEAGHRKLMKVLRDCIMLYFIERGEAVFRVSEREITGQVGSTFFIPLGFEHTITNSKTEDLILKFIKMSPTTVVP